LFLLLEQGNPVSKQLHVLLCALARDPLVGQGAREGPVVVAGLLALVVIVVVVVWVAGILLHVLLALSSEGVSQVTSV
jgi:type IV secretory pathway TrbD component